MSDINNSSDDDEKQKPVDASIESTPPAKTDEFYRAYAERLRRNIDFPARMQERWAQEEEDKETERKVRILINAGAFKEEDAQAFLGQKDSLYDFQKKSREAATAALIKDTEMFRSQQRIWQAQQDQVNYTNNRLYAKGTVAGDPEVIRVFSLDLSNQEDRWTRLVRFDRRCLRQTPLSILHRVEDKVAEFNRDNVRDTRFESVALRRLELIDELFEQFVHALEREETSIAEGEVVKVEIEEEQAANFGFLLTGLTNLAEQQNEQASVTHEKISSISKDVESIREEAVATTVQKIGQWAFNALAVIGFIVALLALLRDYYGWSAT